MELAELLREGEALKRAIADDTKRLRNINQQVAAAAQFKGGAKTGHAVAGGIRAKVTLRENTRWDQGRLAQLKAWHPELFRNAFASEYKPLSAKALEAVAGANPDFAQGVTWARTVSDGAPQVEYELLEDVPNAA